MGFGEQARAYLRKSPRLKLPVRLSLLALSVFGLALGFQSLASGTAPAIKGGITFKDIAPDVTGGFCTR